MESMRGVLHKTSVQEAQERQAGAVGPPPLAGQKRSWSTTLDDADTKGLPLISGATTTSISAPNSQGSVRYQKAPLFSSPAATRLSASKIVSLDASEDPSEYTQRRVFAATPSSSIDDELDLAHPVYNLPPQLVNNFASLGIKQIYPWQKNCLKGPGLLTGAKNLVYCAPTGGGKSLVADCEPSCRIHHVATSQVTDVLPSTYA